MCFLSKVSSVNLVFLRQFGVQDCQWGGGCHFLSFLVGQGIWCVMCQEPRAHNTGWFLQLLAGAWSPASPVPQHAASTESLWTFSCLSARLANCCSGPASKSPSGIAQWHVCVDRGTAATPPFCPDVLKAAAEDIVERPCLCFHRTLCVQTEI